MGTFIGARGRPRAGSEGQVIVLFALGIVALCAMAGLLVDGARAWADQRQAQAAADTAALAAAYAASHGDTSAASAAGDLSTANGFAADLVDCAGVTQPGKGVVVNRPPTSGPHSAANDPRASDYVEVITTRAMRTTFAGVVGQDCWLVSARAVASIPSTGVATCNLCALSDWLAYSTLMIDNSANLRVDGDIIVNQDTWYAGTEAVNRCGTNPCTPPSCSDWNGLPSDQRIRMCGDSVYIAHTGGASNSLVSANTVSVNGGWQTTSYRDVLRADALAPGCLYHPRALAWAFPDNVCIGMPKIADPLNDPDHLENFIDLPDTSKLTVPVAGEDGCPANADVPTGTLASPHRLTISGGAATSLHWICPGLYYGGFAVNGDSRQPKVTMLPGIYFIVGGGFNVTGTASITGEGVTVFNSSGTDAFSQNTLPGSDLVPPCNSGTSSCLAPVITGGGNGLSGPSTWSINNPVTFHMQLLKVSGQPKPTGTIAFYDGQAPIACTPVYGGDANHLWAECTTTYSRFGTRWITAVYSGDAVYAPTGDTHKLTVNPPSGEAGDNINICTGAVCGSTAVCNDPSWPCSQVILHASTSGDYAGLLFFQGRSLGLGVKLWPYVGADACTGDWMTDGVPPDAHRVPAPCGPLGGLSGTIYAPHQSTGSSDWDAVVNINASGLANVQIIAAEIALTYDRDVRLTYDPSAFANGRLHLVE